MFVRQVALRHVSHIARRGPCPSPAVAVSLAARSAGSDRTQGATAVPSERLSRVMVCSYGSPQGSVAVMGGSLRELCLLDRHEGEPRLLDEGFVRRDDGVAIGFRTYGESRPGMARGDVLLVHGSLQSSRVWAKYGYLARLCRRYRVTTIDVRGHGVSDKPQEAAGYDIRASVSDVCAVLDRLGIDKTHYIGFSLGGRIGLTLAASAPGRLLSLVVAGGSHRPQRGGVEHYIFPGAASVAEECGLAAFVEQWESHHGVAMGNGCRATIAALGSHGLAAMLLQWDAEPGLADEVLSRIATPTLFFAGSQDRLRLADSRDAAARMPNAYFSLLEGCDHSQTIAMCEPILAQALPLFLLSEFSGIERTGVAG